MTESDYQSALDADPADAALRTSFADHLAAAGDARAEGHRALAVLGKFSRRCHGDSPESRTFFSARRVLLGSPRALPATLFNEVVRKCGGVEGLVFVKDAYRNVEAIQGRDRRTLEDAVAATFGGFTVNTQKRLVAEMLKKMGREGAAA